MGSGPTDSTTMAIFDLLDSFHFIFQPVPWGELITSASTFSSVNLTILQHIAHYPAVVHQTFTLLNFEVDFAIRPHDAIPGNERRRKSQQGHRIASRRALKTSGGVGWTVVKVKNRIRDTGQAYTTSRSSMLFLAIMTLASCLFYIVATYLEHARWVLYIETAFGVIFLIDYVLSVAAAPLPLSYALSTGGLIDLISCLPAFGAFQPWMTSLAFIRYLRVSKAIRVMRNHRLLSSIFSDDDFTIKATLLIVKVLGVVLMTSAILYGVERGMTSEGDGTGTFNEPGWQWHDALYFTIVTLSTVGYGDVLPVSVLGRLIMVAVIVFALTYVPLEVGKLVDAVNARPKFRKGFSRSLLGNQIHVVLAMPGGSSSDRSKRSGFEYDTLERCINEFFDEDYITTNSVALWVVVMAPTVPTPEINALCNSPKYHGRLVYFRGSVLNPQDMDAVCAEYADCIFLFPSVSVESDVRAAEERTHLAAKAVRRYLDRTPTDEDLLAKVRALSHNGTPRRTVVTVEEVHSKDQLLGFGIDHVICHDELKMAMLSAATLSPAFLPFVANCVRSCDGRTSPSAGGPDKGASEHVGSASGRPAKGPRKRKSGRFAIRHQADDWLEDYTRGALFEIYSIPLDVLSENSSLWGMTFRSAARVMYEESEGKVLLLAAVESADERSSHIVPFASRRRWTSSSRSHLGGAARDSGSMHKSEEARTVVDIFPDESFRFTIDCTLMVLAETQTVAEDLVFNFQGPGDERDMHASATSVAASGAIQSPFSTPVATSAAASSKPADDSCAVATSAVGSTAPFPPAFSPDGDANFNRGAVGAASSRNDADDGRAVPPIVVDDLAHSDGAKEAPSDNSQNLPSIRTLSAMATTRSFQSSPAGSAAGSTFSGGCAMYIDNETKGQLGKFMKDAFELQEINWIDALNNLRQARSQLDALDMEASSSRETDPVAFFQKVEHISSCIADVVQLRTSSLPPGLAGHTVLAGGHGRLQHYVLALRRQRPSTPVVVVTEDQASFLELRDCLMECKLFEKDVEIGNIYHVFGRPQDRVTLEQANVAQARSVVLVSDTHDDASVLLATFELEQVLEEIPPDDPHPRVLIDLWKDSSIYYCGIVLGGEGCVGTRVKEALPSQEVNSDDVRYWPLFAAGRVWTTSIMDVFAVRTYFNAHVLRFFESLLLIVPTLLVEEQRRESSNWDHARGAMNSAGRGSRASGRHQRPFVVGAATSGGFDENKEGDDGGRSHGIERRTDGRADQSQNGVRHADGPGDGRRGRAFDGGGAGAAANPSRSQFSHLRVSANFSGKSYGDLVRHLIGKGAMPLGLYRPAGTKGSALAYAHMNPDPSEQLRTWPRETRTQSTGPKSSCDYAQSSWDESRSPSQSAANLLRGDEVFVIRSKICKLSGEV